MKTPKALKEIFNECRSAEEVLARKGWAEVHKMARAMDQGYADMVVSLIESGVGRKDGEKGQKSTLDRLTDRHNRGLLFQGELPFPQEEARNQHTDYLIESLVAEIPEIWLDDRLVDVREALSDPDLASRLLDRLNERAVATRKIADRANWHYVVASQIIERIGLIGDIAAE